MGAPQYEQAGADVAGTGTTNTIPRWTGPSTLGDSVITQSGAVGAQTITIARPDSATAPLLALMSTTAVSGDTLALRVGVSSPANYYFDFTRSVTTGALLVQGNQAFYNNICLAPTSGNVGIGTASPTAGTRLHVLDSAGSAIVRVQSTTAGTGGNVILQGATFGQVENIAGDLFVTNSSATGAILFRTAATNIERMRISASGTQAQSQVAIGTSSFTSGRALTTVADLDVFGVRVGRGASGVSDNTAVGAAALASVTTGSGTVGVGFESLNALTTGVGNTAVGYRALWNVSTTNSNTAVGYLACGNRVGTNNTGIGQQALQGAVGSSGNNNTGAGYQTGLALTTGAGNTLLGSAAGDSITTGNSNIVIGSGADVAAAGDSNQLVLGDATNYVATNGGATTYYATAGASLGYMRVRLNGTYVKIEVFADV